MYQVSNSGNVKSLRGWNGHQYVRREKLLTPTLTTTGYLKVELTTKTGERKSHKVHRLIAKAFVGNPNNKPSVNHIDGNKLNNSLSNLEWCTQQENVQHAVDTKLKSSWDISREKLQKLYIEQRMTCKQIGVLYNKSAPTVSRKLRKYGIPLRNSSECRDKYRIPLDKLLHDMRQGQTNAQLARKYKCTNELIATRRYQFKKKGKL